MPLQLHAWAGRLAAAAGCGRGRIAWRRQCDSSSFCAGSGDTGSFSSGNFGSGQEEEGREWGSHCRDHRWHHCCCRAHDRLQRVHRFYNPRPCCTHLSSHTSTHLPLFLHAYTQCMHVCMHCNLEIRSAFVIQKRRKHNRSTTEALAPLENPVEN